MNHVTNLFPNSKANSGFSVLAFELENIQEDRKQDSVTCINALMISEHMNIEGAAFEWFIGKKLGYWRK
jgi:hypothetical protein